MGRRGCGTPRRGSLCRRLALPKECWHRLCARWQDHPHRQLRSGGPAVGCGDRPRIAAVQRPTPRGGAVSRSRRTANRYSPASGTIQRACGMPRRGSPECSNSLATPQAYSTSRSPRTANRYSPAADDGTARLWDAATGSLADVLRPYRPVRGIALRPRQDRPHRRHRDGTARLWDAQTGQELLHSFRQRGGVRSVAFAPTARPSSPAASIIS